MEDTEGQEEVVRVAVARFRAASAAGDLAEKYEAAADILDAVALRERRLGGAAAEATEERSQRLRALARAARGEGP